MDDQGLLERSAANLAGTFVPWVRAMGGRYEEHQDVWLCDLGLLDRQTPNGAFLMQPMSQERLDEVVGRVTEFFEGAPGGGYELWSPWPTPDLTRFGFEADPVPAMARPSGGQAPPLPGDLDLVEVTEEDALREAESLLTRAFDMNNAQPGDVLGPELLGSGIIRIWLGKVDGVPVSTAAAHVGDDVVGVYAVTTREDMRGRGYGAAMTWAATLSAPDLPAVLQASEMGVSVYAKMGYRQIGTFTVWGRDER